MNRRIIIANWKMALTLKEAEDLTQEILKGLNEKDTQNTDVVLCPSFTALKSIGEIIKKSDLSVSLGAQNVFWQERGAYTGEISPLMLKELGVKYIIIGHSERRENLNETNEMINKKIKIAAVHDFIPILCLGETMEQRENRKTEKIVKNQLKKALENIKIRNLIIAYEPVWAIGAGRTVEPAEAERVAELIREETKNIENLNVIYGGSIDSNNIKGFLEKNINGFLVSGASLNAGEFIKMIKTLS